MRKTQTGGWIRGVSFGIIATALVALNSTPSLPQSAERVKTSAPALAPVPTIKLLAIGSFTAKATPKVWKPILPSEMRETARLYLAGKIDQWYVKQDQSGVVFIMNLTNPEEAHKLLETLPMGKAGVMTFQIIPLGPLSPLRTLLPKPSEK